MSFLVIVISPMIDLNFSNSSSDFFGIQFCPFWIIFLSSVNTRSSLVALAIDAIPILSIIGVVCLCTVDYVNLWFPSVRFLV